MMAWCQAGGALPGCRSLAPWRSMLTYASRYACAGAAQNGRGKGGSGPTLPAEKEKKQEWVDLDSRRRARLNRRSERREERLANAAVREVGPGPDAPSACTGALAQIRR